MLYNLLDTKSKNIGNSVATYTVGLNISYHADSSKLWALSPKA
jgi:hypothetical protein